ncbi:hypothetical protein U1710_02450 [Aeromonas caviae]|uniref:hypothetical protein n=1 Tax=Aeromonas TaxID=642 RepID=UPI002250013C|nr:hypothetical protein [Aeromonas hydrophila]MCX4116288.1 hypothetical protein [Aeromonas hydrophila]
MSNSHIRLSVTRGMRRLPPHHGSQRDDTLRDALQKLLQRGVAGVRCYHCAVGVEPEVGEVTHLNGDHTDMTPSNLELACELCHGSQHLDMLEEKLGSDLGKMIYLPELEQGELNSLVWAIAYSFTQSGGSLSPEKMNGIEYEYSGMKIYMMLDKRSSLVPSEINTVGRFSQFLKKMSDNEYVNRQEVISNIRWLPPLEHYKDLAVKGYGLSFSKIDFSSWPSLIGEV